MLPRSPGRRPRPAGRLRALRVSVVINTANRADSLETTLDALRRQTHEDFEVVVVHGPSEDGTEALLAERADDLRTIACPERNLAVSRNLGIDAAAGEVVAFIDDDAVPEARWLEDLARPYARDAVGGAGGLTLDPTGVRPQYRYAVCDRIGRTDFDRRPPLHAFVRPGADPFLYLQGTNCSFRRAALERVEGFDEEIEYDYDETEVCARVLDAGWTLRALDGAVVHHRFLPAHLRRDAGFRDPFLSVKNRVYFALRVGAGHRSREEALESLHAWVQQLQHTADDELRRGALSEADRERFGQRVDEGFALGLERGTAGVRRGRPIALADPAAFRPYPPLRPDGDRLSVCFASLTAPPPALARERAAAGHEVHVVTRGDRYTLSYDDGIWVHRVPVGERWLPELDAHPLRGELERAAALRGAVVRAAQRVHFDRVVAPADERLLLAAPDVPALLEQRYGLAPDDARHAAAVLLDPARFPVDLEAGVRRALEHSPEACVEGLFETLLGRLATAEGLAAYVPRLAAGEDPNGLVREIATSVEARAREIDLGFLDRLPSVSGMRVRQVVGPAWLLEDEAAFARTVSERLPGIEVEPARNRAGRAAALQAALPGTDLSWLAGLRSQREVAAELAAARADPERRLAAIYRRLLGREPDAAGRAAHLTMDPVDAVREIGTSEEAAGRGVPPEVVERLAASLRRRGLRRLRRPVSR